MTREEFVNYMNQWDIPECFYSIEEKTKKFGIHLEKLDNDMYCVYYIDEYGCKNCQINFVRIEDAYFAAVLYARYRFISWNDLTYVATTDSSPFPYETSLEVKQFFVQDWKRWKQKKDQREGRDENESQSKFVQFMGKLFESRSQKEEKRKKKEFEYWLISNKDNCALNDK